MLNIKRRLLLICALLFLASCSNTKYISTWEPFTEPKENKTVALKICQTEGKVAGMNATASHQSKVEPTYKTTCNGYSCKTTQQTDQWAKLGEGLGKGLARADAKNAAIEVCMAHLGYEKIKTCVKNCR